MINLRTTAFWSAGLPFAPTPPFFLRLLLFGCFLPVSMAIELINYMDNPEIYPIPPRSIGDLAALAPRPHPLPSAAIGTT